MLIRRRNMVMRGGQSSSGAVSARVAPSIRFASLTTHECHYLWLPERATAFPSRSQDRRGTFQSGERSTEGTELPCRCC